ncbi:flagellar export chaperone FliS [Candidatus Methylomicrobium oryzae]|jgi:flagellar protein FliS|uniref:flagellar export chaperone FliS n=1 Tax=Candidatus Methylomicrobium oryzae TaxID=2802053 RepID=UPI001924506E|nr:flagellar export chaperone FliS [Methylomicrobium sp. RS1]MBL1265093.1 flagellar export chaperone FliS [Methylomicrobium sp. RS1]
MNASLAMNQYKEVRVQSSVMDATPHRLIQMLMEGVLEKIALAKGNILRKEIAQKGENISKAITIVGGLQASLDKEKGGELAENLNSLYDYMSQRLLMANIQSNEAILDEVADLMLEIKAGWDEIPGILNV